MGHLTSKRILLGVSGGIAAYKGAELVRGLRRQGAQVRCVMTRGAQAFITPLTLQALSGNPVHTELLDPAAESAMGHIELARWADLVLIAPASANVLARLAHGLADDLLCTLCLATRAPLVLAPAMNRVMWSAPATRANHQLLLERGCLFLGPDEGDQACGETGPGRMREPEALVQALLGLFGHGPLAGRRVLVTAGPTREAIDPVRFVGNRSSGKMGYAVAAAAVAAGARVTLVSGPVALNPPAGVERVDAFSAEDMHAAVMARARDSDIFIATAAVADYRPRRVAPHKIKKDAQVLTLEMERTPDILAAVAALDGGPLTVGFAAETRDLEDNARAKLSAKGLDMIAANRVDAPGAGFESDDNALSVYWRGGGRELALAPKRQLAKELVELIAERYDQKSRTQDS